MLNGIKKIINRILQVDPMVKEYWETSVHGHVPEFPAILIDKTIKDDFIFLIKPEHYYTDESFGLKPNMDEVIIDSRGCVFAVGFNSENKFRIPKLISKDFSVDELKSILKHYWNIKNIGIDDYLKLNSVGEIIQEMELNRAGFGYRLRPKHDA